MSMSFPKALGVPKTTHKKWLSPPPPGHSGHHFPCWVETRQPSQAWRMVSDHPFWHTLLRGTQRKSLLFSTHTPLLSPNWRKGGEGELVTPWECLCKPWELGSVHRASSYCWCIILCSLYSSSTSTESLSFVSSNWLSVVSILSMSDRDDTCRTKPLSTGISG